MEYYKDYKGVEFRVSFALNRNSPKRLSFAAQPYEQMIDNKTKDNPDTYLVYGMVEDDEILQMGFTSALVNMTESFHDRLGQLYEIVLKEYRMIILEK